MSVALFAGSAGAGVGATALRVTGNYHLTIAILSGVAIVGLFAGLFLTNARALYTNRMSEQNAKSEEDAVAAEVY